MTRADASSGRLWPDPDPDRGRAFPRIVVVYRRSGAAEHTLAFSYLRVLIRWLREMGPATVVDIHLEEESEAWAASATYSPWGSRTEMRERLGVSHDDDV